MSGLRNDLARCLRAGGAARERQQGDVAGALDGYAQPALMTRADSRHAARKNLAALLHELREDVRALVVDEIHLFDAELANFLLAEILTLAAGTADGTSRATAARSAFAARATMAAAWTAVPARTAFAARRPTVSLCLLLFLGHYFLPSPRRT